MKGAGHGSALTLWIKGVFFMLKVLYLLNFAGKAGTERYVETLVKYLSADGLVQPFFAYNEGGLLVERLEAMGVPCRRSMMRLEKRVTKSLARTKWLV